MIAKRLLAIQKASSPPAPAATDVYYDYRSLILNMQGSAGSTTFTDSSPNNFTVTPYGNAQLATVPGESVAFLTAASFDGNGDRLNLASNAAFGFGTGDFTVEAWIYLNSINNNYAQVLPNVPVSGGFSVYYTGPGNYYGVGANSIIISNRISNYGSIPFTWNTNTWYHMAVSRSNGSLRVFMNGTQVGSTITNTPNYATGGMNIGGNTDNAAHTVNGLVGPLRISPWAVYKSNFTPSANLFPAIQGVPAQDPYYDKNSLLLNMQGSPSSTVFVDESPNAFAVTPYGNAQLVSDATFGTVASFDGSGDYLSIPSNAAFAFGTGNFTVEMWAYLYNTLTSANLYESRASTEANRPVLYVFGNTVRYYHGTGDAIISNTITTNQWYHIAVSRSSGTTRLFVNGVQQGSNFSDTRDYGIGANRPLIGTYNPSAAFINGLIGPTRITKGVARYTSNFTPPVRGLSTIYNPYTTLPVSGAALWLDGADSTTLFTDAGVTPVTKSGDLIYQWSDKSGNNRHAAQVTSGNRPTWVPPASGQNGFGAVSFNGSSSFVEGSWQTFDPLSIYMVFKHTSGTTGSRVFTQSDATNYDTQQVSGSTNWVPLAVVAGPAIASYSTTDASIGSVSLTSSTWLRIKHLRNGTSIVNSVTNTTSSTTISAITRAMTKYTLGRVSNFNGGYVGMQVGECVAFNKVLSTNEETSMNSYLKAKWGTP